MLSLNFLFYLLGCAAAYFFSRSYVGWYGGYLLWAVIILPPALTLLSLPSMLSLRIGCRAPDTVNLGEAAELSIKFSCRRLLPVRACRFTLRVRNVFTGEESAQTMHYALVSNSSSFVTLPTSRSGVLLCSIEDLRIYGYMGLISIRPKILGSASCTVIPKACAPEDMSSIEALPQVAVNYRPKPGGGYAEEHELREYRPGDNINSIHWKLSSKTDKLIIREPMEPVDLGTAVLLLTHSEADLAHLCWLSLRLCAGNIKHSIHFGSSSLSVENETDCLRAIRSLLSEPAAACPDTQGSYGRVFKVANGEVRWQ